jgi:hypothetical protein
MQLVSEVLDHAPPALTVRERLLLVAIAENANDRTREGWPGMEKLMCRMGGVSERYVRQVLKDLADHGCDVRVPAGLDKHGRPVFATRAHRTVYRIPVLRRKGGGIVPPFEARKEAG